MDKRNIEVCFSPVSYHLFANENAIVVVIDVLRATSAICTAFHHGVDRIIPVATIEEAEQYKNRGFMAAAERHGEIVSGFEFGNSPFSYMGENIKGKTIVLTTTNGTQAINVSRDAHKVVIGSFLNLTVLSDYLLNANKDVILLCSGWKNKFNMEDTLLAGAIAKRLLADPNFYTTCDSSMAAVSLYELGKKNLNKFLENSSHRRRLQRLDLERDIKYCLTSDQCPVIPVLDGNVLEAMVL